MQMFKVLLNPTIMGSMQIKSKQGPNQLSLQGYNLTTSQMLLDLQLVNLEVNFWMKIFLKTQMLLIAPTPQCRVTSTLESKSTK